jgi:hypothetical protein
MSTSVVTLVRDRDRRPAGAGIVRALEFADVHEAVMTVRHAPSISMTRDIATWCSRTSGVETNVAAETLGRRSR